MEEGTIFMIVMIVIAAAVIFFMNFAAGGTKAGTFAGNSPKAVPRESGQRPEEAGQYLQSEVQAAAPGRSSVAELQIPSPQPPPSPPRPRASTSRISTGAGLNLYNLRGKTQQFDPSITPAQRRRRENNEEFDRYSEDFLLHNIDSLSPHYWPALTGERRQNNIDKFYSRVATLKSDVMASKNLQKHMKDSYFHDTNKRLTNEELSRNFIPLISRHAIVSRQRRDEKSNNRPDIDVTRINRDKLDVISSLSTRPGAKLELAKAARRNDNWLGLMPPDIIDKIGEDYM